MAPIAAATGRVSSPAPRKAGAGAALTKENQNAGQTALAAKQQKGGQAKPETAAPAGLRAKRVKCVAAFVAHWRLLSLLTFFVAASTTVYMFGLPESLPDKDTMIEKVSNCLDIAKDRAGDAVATAGVTYASVLEKLSMLPSWVPLAGVAAATVASAISMIFIGKFVVKRCKGKKDKAA